MASDGKGGPEILCAKAAAWVLVQLCRLFLSATAEEKELQAREGSAATFGDNGAQLMIPRRGDDATECRVSGAE